jgi:L-ascorbate metabolism protein UlaG (beta-lactamase superfamily)
MRNPVWIGLGGVLIIALVGIYMASVGPKELARRLSELAERVDTQIQTLNLKSSPYVYVGEPVGYVIEFENGAKFYFAGDTGVSADMKLVIGDYYKPDVAFLPIGNFYTMDPKAAAYAAKLINPSRYVVPNHYGSFPMLVQEPDEFFTEVAKYSLKAKPLRFEKGVEQEVMGVKVLWLGHGDWLFTTPEGTKILVDPEVEYNLAYPEEYKDLTRFGRIDLILITHGHFDHMTVPDLRKWIKLYEPVLIAPFEAGIWLKDVLPYDKVMAINKGSDISKTEMLKMGMSKDQVAKISNIRIYMVPATHSSSATPEGLPARY